MNILAVGNWILALVTFVIGMFIFTSSSQFARSGRYLWLIVLAIVAGIFLGENVSGMELFIWMMASIFLSQVISAYIVLKRVSMSRVSLKPKKKDVLGGVIGIFLFVVLAVCLYLYWGLEYIILAIPGMILSGIYAIQETMFSDSGMLYRNLMYAWTDLAAYQWTEDINTKDMLELRIDTKSVWAPDIKLFGCVSNGLKVKSLSGKLSLQKPNQERNDDFQPTRDYTGHSHRI
jgi:hypothetical protein